MALTSLSTLALMASGSTPDRGPYRIEIARALKWIEGAQQRSGYFDAHDATGMGQNFEHACGTLLLACIYGMSPPLDDHKRESLQKAMNILGDRQSKSDGGWGPQGKTGTDVGVTAMAYLALRAGQACGVNCGAVDLKKLKEYVESVASPNERIYALSSALRMLYGLKGPDEKARTMARSLLRLKYGQDHGKISEWDYMAAFYSVGALMHDEKNPAWETWYNSTQKFLMKIQHEDGFWIIEYCLQCKVFATSLALLSLQTPTRLLPFHQY